MADQLPEPNDDPQNATKAGARRQPEAASRVRATASSIQTIRDNVPAELLALRNWVGWDGTRKANGKLDKTPIDPRTGDVRRLVAEPEGST